MRFMSIGLLQVDHSLRKMKRKYPRLGDDFLSGETRDERVETVQHG